MGLSWPSWNLWIVMDIKEFLFPDSTWEKKTSVWYGLYIWFGLTLYWLSGWIINSGIFNNGLPQIAPPWLIGLCVSLFGYGVFLHFCSDMYKHTMLEQRPGKLIDSGIMVAEILITLVS